MVIQPFSFNPFATNSYVCHDAGEAVLIDASAHTQAEQEIVTGYIEENDLTVRHLLLTHAHIDHIFGCAFFAERYAKEWQMHRADVPFIDRAEDQAVAFGITLERPPLPKRFLEEGDTIPLGRTELRVLHTPGHSPGSVCFYEEQESDVLSGDVLFQGSIGRTDLPQGSMPQLMQSISKKLLPLGDKTRVYPGHGPATTVGQERKTNPFLVERYSA